VMLHRPVKPSLYQARVDSFRLLPSRSQPIIRASMHALRFLWERIERARTAAKSKSDFLRLAEATIKRRFLLTRVGKAGAPPTREQLAGAIKHRCTALAAATDEPRTPPAKAASCPGNRHALFDRLPIVALASHSVDQGNSVQLGSNVNCTVMDSTPGPRTREATSAAQTFAIPPAHVDPPARFAGPTTTIGGTSPTRRRVRSSPSSRCARILVALWLRPAAAIPTGSRKPTFGIT
jgi:hypothetical protein